MSILEAQSAPINGVQVEARSGDPSAVAGASILASLSNLHKDLSLLSPDSKTGKNVQQNTDISSLPYSGHGDDIADTEMKDTINNDELAGDFSAEKTVLASSTTVNENPSLDAEVDTNIDADIGKMTAATYELRPLLRMLGSCSEFDLSGSISKILEDQRNLLLKNVDSPTVLASTKRQAFKDSLQQRILKAENIDVSFETFPYYLR